MPSPVSSERVHPPTDWIKYRDPQTNIRWRSGNQKKEGGENIGAREVRDTARTPTESTNRKD